MTAPEEHAADAEQEHARMRADVSDEGRAYQAARDQYIAERDLHLHYADGTREGARRVIGGAAAQDAEGECPYPGLAAFGPEQAQWFFGRDRLTAEVTSRAAELAREGGFLITVAPSGAGKSSLLGAGLLPALNRGALPIAGSQRWPCVVMTPTARPVATLATHIATVTGDDTASVVQRLKADPEQQVVQLRSALRGRIGAHNAANARVVIIVDQLEELFTLCEDESERLEFIAWLSRLAHPIRQTPPIALVVMGLRADFYAPCANYPELRASLQHNQVLVGPMLESELREAILYPARAVGLQLEPGLPELLLRDLGGISDGSNTGDSSTGEAGRLPFLAHALEATWQQRHGSTLTVAGYQVTGGIRHAIAATAERVYDRLDETDRQLARELLLRLVKIGDGTEDVRRRLARDEVLRSDAISMRRKAVLDAFTRARLLSQEQDTVEIAHEALVRGWPRLRQWIEADRAGHVVHQELEEAAAEWERSGRRDSSLLYRGARLEAALAWASTEPSNSLSLHTETFLTVSQRQQRRTTRLRRSAVIAVTFLALVASTTAVVAFQQRSAAQQNSSEARQQRDQAIINQVIAEADQYSGTNASLAAQLDLVAYHMQPSSQLLTKILNTQSLPLGQPLNSQAGGVKLMAFSPVGHTMATASLSGSVRLWNVTNPAKPIALGQPLTEQNGAIQAVTFSSDGRTIATGSVVGSVRLWNVTDPAKPIALGQPVTDYNGAIIAIAFSPDGRTIAITSLNGSVQLWNVADPAKPIPLGKPLAEGCEGTLPVAFSPDKQTLATINCPRGTFANGGVGGVVQLWNVSDPARPISLGQPITDQKNGIYAVAFSPDMHTLAIAIANSSADGGFGTVRLWDVSNPAQPIALGQSLIDDLGSVTSIAFSPDGYTLAVASTNGPVQLWNVSNPRLPALLGQSLSGQDGSVISIAFSPDGHTLAAISSDFTVEIWDLPRATLTGQTDGVTSVAFSPSGRTFVSAGGDGTLRLWSTVNPVQPVEVGQPLAGQVGAFSVAFSPDGQTLATGSLLGAVQLWNMTDPQPVEFGQPLTRQSSAIDSVAFSPVGHILAAAGDDGTVQLWNVTNPAQPSLLGQPLVSQNGAVATINSVKFSPNGSILAAADSDGTVQLWNMVDPFQPTRLGQPLIGQNGTLSPIYSIAFSPNGGILAAAGGDGTLQLWNVVDPAQSSPLGQPLTSQSASISSVAFSPDGHILAAGGIDGTIQLWSIVNLAQPVELGQPLTGQNGSVSSMAFSPNGRTLVTASLAGTVQAWSLTIGDAIHWICTATGRSLSDAIWDQYVSSALPYNPPCG
jgi:WD40 repeat protein